MDGEMLCRSVACLLVAFAVTISGTILLDIRKFVFGKTICCIAPADVLFGISPLDCLRQCMSFADCNVITYQRKSLQCRLFDITDFGETFEEDDSTFIMAYMKKLPEDLISPCRRQLCSGFTKCVVKDNGNTNCVPFGSYTNQWIPIYETDDNRNVVSGRLEDLNAAFESASVLRMIVPSWNQTFRIDSVNFKYDKAVCAQSIFIVEKATWNTLSTTATHVFYSFCTSGLYTKSKYHLGMSSRPSDPVVTDSIGMKWFIRYGFRHLEHHPIYCKDIHGNQSCGSFSKLLSVVRRGFEVHINIYPVVSPFVDQLIVTDNKIGALRQRRLKSYSKVSSDGQKYREFKNLWAYRISSSDGLFQTDVWSIGNHVKESQKTSYKNATWFVDTCWSTVYSHDNTGNAEVGSLRLLRASILAGKRIRLVINGNVSGESDCLFMKSNGHVTAQLLTMASVSNQDHFQIDNFTFWQMISSTGFVNVIRMYLESNEVESRESSRYSVDWHADTRSWRKLLTMSSTGQVTSGSKYELSRSLKLGGKLRLVVTLSDNTVMAFCPDNIEFYQEEVAAQFTRLVEHQTKPDSEERIFTSTPCWRLIMVSTEGILTSSSWVVGEKLQKSNSSSQVTTSWFVN